MFVWQWGTPGWLSCCQQVTSNNCHPTPVQRLCFVFSVQCCYFRQVRLSGPDDGSKRLMMDGNDRNGKDWALLQHIYALWAYIRCSEVKKLSQSNRDTHTHTRALRWVNCWMEQYDGPPIQGSLLSVAQHQQEYPFSFQWLTMIHVSSRLMWRSRDSFSAFLITHTRTHTHAIAGRGRSGKSSRVSRFGEVTMFCFASSPNVCCFRVR